MADLNYELPRTKDDNLSKLQIPESESGRNSTNSMGDDLFIADFYDVREDSPFPPIIADDESSIEPSEDLQSLKENAEINDFMTVTEIASNTDDIRKELYNRYINQSSHWAGNLKKYLPQALSKQRDRSKSVLIRKDSRNSMSQYRTQSAFVFNSNAWE